MRLYNLLINIIIVSFIKCSQNSSLFWGTYRPNLYFGTKTRSQNPLLTGLMWTSVNNGYEKFVQMRHECDQNDKLDHYAWNKHNGRNFASQTLKDSNHNVQISTEFVKSLVTGEHGGDWSVRISGKSLTEEENIINVIFYFGLDGEGTLKLENEPDIGGNTGYDGPVFFNGKTKDLGKFTIGVVDSGEERDLDEIIPTVGNVLPKLDNTHVLGLATAKDEVWKVKKQIQTKIVENANFLHSKKHNNPPLVRLLVLPNKIDSGSKTFVVSKTLKTPFQFDVSFVSESIHQENLQDYILKKMTGEKLTELISKNSVKFDERFENTFGLQEKGYNEEEIAFSKTLMSNLIGGIGYFHGKAIVDRGLEGFDADEPIDFVDDDDDDGGEDFFDDGGSDDYSANRPKVDPKEEGPFSLFTATPSRPFFPRGFLWDEGFHQLLVGSWDNDLSLDILKHWSDLIDSNGWVAREQILGDEARSKVPKEFQVQYPHFANPPTLILALKKFVERIATTYSAEGSSYLFESMKVISQDDPLYLANYHLLDRNLADEYLRTVYSNFRRQYFWFKSTQWGDLNYSGRSNNCKLAFRWRGRSDQHTLTSGLDDYPRASPPHAGELHVDLLSWVGFFAKTLRSCAIELGLQEDVREYENDYKEMLISLNELHWDSKEEGFFDLTIDEVTQQSKKIIHKGYITIFPFLLQLLDANDSKLDSLLNLIKDPKHLWTDFGLASLSKSDKLFGTSENYWRGPVWININYLACSALHYYSNQEGPYRMKAMEIYKSLRVNVVNNVFKVFKETGFMWEQYSANDGKGKRSHPFTGWTSLVTLIMAEKY
ncbi:Processing alpha glucosidase I [Clydaea vesicula]|uniref:Mannosyl-oligosaccharide glucosidase n=1 Tax=Clydaea vesicula TaxID=447962 RepID=A0AAD5TVZ8_9FUNG|nr:Processing alpha glucosidase I [Clydaea vesicula]KAJ3379490.1 Processing alpha glucosidase I [Lobulomyces angularis]